MAKPLGLPVGSVRALLLFALVARGILDLHAGRGLSPYLGVAVLLSGVAYLAARASRRGLAPATAGEPKTARPPLGLPAGTVRTLFLVAVGYGTWLWLRENDLYGHRASVFGVVAAFVAGVVLRWLLAAAPRPHDAATFAYEHVQALVALVCAAGLVVLGVIDGPARADWVEPALVAVCTYYAGAR
jgi:hypothetical protein